MRVLATIFLPLVLAACATGSHIVTGKTYPPTNPADVTLYLEPPTRFETIGLVEAASDVELSAQAAQDRVIQELKNQAAKIGANGVLLLDASSQPVSQAHFVSGNFFVSTGEKKTARGRAILVPRD